MVSAVSIGLCIWAGEWVWGKRDFKRRKTKSELSEKPPCYPQMERDTSLAVRSLCASCYFCKGSISRVHFYTQRKSEEPAQDFIHHCLSITEAKLISQEDANGTPPAVPSVPQTL